MSVLDLINYFQWILREKGFPPTKNGSCTTVAMPGGGGTTLWYAPPKTTTFFIDVAPKSEETGYEILCIYE